MPTITFDYSNSTIQGVTHTQEFFFSEANGFGNFVTPKDVAQKTVTITESGGSSTFDVEFFSPFAGDAVTQFLPGPDAVYVLDNSANDLPHSFWVKRRRRFPMSMRSFRTSTHPSQPS